MAKSDAGKGTGTRRRRVHLQRPGDPPPKARNGSGTPLAPHETEAIKLINAATKRYGEDDDIIRLGLGVLIGISRGDTDQTGAPFLRRYVGERIKAVTELIDRTHGKPIDRAPLEDPNKFADVDRVLASLLQGKG